LGGVGVGGGGVGGVPPHTATTPLVLFVCVWYVGKGGLGRLGPGCSNRAPEARPPEKDQRPHGGEDSQHWLNTAKIDPRGRSLALSVLRAAVGEQNAVAGWE